jgi:hypothetical protein
MAGENNPTAGTESLDQRIAQWEKERKGLISDLQEERSKRHTMETRLQELETAVQTVGEERVPEEANVRVQRLAQDPDAYIDARVEARFKERLEPLSKTIESLQLSRQYDRAYSFLAKQEGKDADDIIGSDLEKEIAEIVKNHGMSNMPPLEGVKAAYKIRKQELDERKRKEAERSEAIESNAGERVITTPNRQGQARFTRAEILGMSPSEYEKNREAIMDAQSKGLIS